MTAGAMLREHGFAIEGVSKANLKQQANSPACTKDSEAMRYGVQCARRSNPDQRVPMTNRKIENIVKGQKLQILPGNATVQQACQCMSECGVGSVLVVDEQSQLKGIFTGRDAVRTLAQGKNGATITLAQAMTPNPVTISPEKRAIDALRTMDTLGFRHLPVVENGRIVGIVTRGLFQGMEIDQLDLEIHLWECIR
jgi:CBS domain-containing protein